MSYSTDIVFSFTTILLSGYFFWLGHRSNHFETSKRPMLWLLLGALILRINVIADPYPHAWDERYHLLVAQNTWGNFLKPTLYKSPVLPYDYTSWISSHVWVHKQPLPLWLMSISSAFTPTIEWTYRIPSLILSTLGTGVTFLLGKTLFNKRIGYLSGFLFAIHGLILEVTGGRVATDHFDLKFLVFVTFSVWFGIKGQKVKSVNLIWSGLFLGFAILSKWLPALIVLLLYFIKRYHSRSLIELLKDLTLILSVAILIAAPWQIYSYINYPLETAWEQGFNAKHITEALEGHGGPWYYHFDKMRMLYGELIYIPILWILYMIFSKKGMKYRTQNLLLNAWIFIPFLFFTFVKTKMQGYTLFAAPALFLLTASFYYFLKSKKERFQGWKKWGIIAIQFLLIALPIRYSIERLKPFDHVHRNPGWNKEVQSLQRIAENNPEAIFLNVNRYIEAMFYTQRTVYSGIPSRKQFQTLLESNQPLFILNADVLPDYIKASSQVQIIEYPFKAE